MPSAFTKEQYIDDALFKFMDEEQYIIFKILFSLFIRGISGLDQSEIPVQ